MSRISVLPIVIAAALGFAAPAPAVPPPLGGLTPFPGTAGCFNSAGTSGCSAYAPQSGGLDLAVDAGTLYASAGGALMAYRRAGGGALTPFDCVATSALAPCATTEGQITSPQKLAVSAATRTLYVTAGTTPASSRILAFRLGTDGGIGARVGCLTEVPATGCRDVHAIGRPRDLALSADGRRLYTAADDATGGLAAFKVDADGTFPLAPQLDGCVIPSGGAAIAGCTIDDLTLASAIAVHGSRLYAAWHGTGQNKSGTEVYPLGSDGAIGPRTGCIALTAEPLCTIENSLTYPQTLLVAPDGGSLAIGTGGQGVTTVALDATGGFGTRLSCDAAFLTAGCVLRPGLGAVGDLALSPDGRTLYAAAGAAGIWVLDRDPATGATSGTAACVAASLLGCTAFAGAGDTSAVAVAPDGARLYANGQAVGVFQREIGPSCTPTSAAVAAPATAATLSLACSDANGDPITYALATGPEHGTATVSPSGAATYTPQSGFAGTDVFTFSATDGVVSSSPANVTVGVVAPAPPAAAPPTAGVIAPASTIDPISSPVRAARLVRFTGRATGDLLQRVEIAVLRLDHGARAAGRRSRAACRRLKASGRLARAVRAGAPCRAAGFLTASGTARWTFNLLRPLPKGRYVIVSRARSRGGIESQFTAALRNRRAFTVR